MLLPKISPGFTSTTSRASVSYLILKLKLPIPLLGKLLSFTGIVTVEPVAPLAFPIDISASPPGVLSFGLLYVSLLSLVSVDLVDLDSELLDGEDVDTEADEEDDDGAVLLIVEVEVSESDVKWFTPNITKAVTQTIITTANITFFMTFLLVYSICFITKKWL